MFLINLNLHKPETQFYAYEHVTWDYKLHICQIARRYYISYPTETNSLAIWYQFIFLILYTTPITLVSNHENVNFEKRKTDQP